ncbi:hypothetical protein D0859_14333 [Hortaea werneckii]|uniref:ABC transporter domain-containing protein n=1 Tax=Hortaea werneckii TaxID=91943 RepID=A0A3M7I8I4_HORWE|nr:hypothetical protein D0859_14333 [Hortaea werneckii]
MAYLASLASLASTSLAPSQTAALNTLFTTANASAHPVQIADLARYDNMNTKDFSHFAYSLNYTQTGCFSQGALPVALASEDICLPGWYCPNSSPLNPPQFCPPYERCQILRANRLSCNPQGLYEPIICPAGFYCPSSSTSTASSSSSSFGEGKEVRGRGVRGARGGKEKKICPKGYFCPQGSTEAMRCDWGAYCPTGAVRQVRAVPLGILVLVDGLVVMGWWVGKGFGGLKRRRRGRKGRVREGGKEEEGVELLRRRCSSARGKRGGRYRDSPQQDNKSASPSREVGMPSRRVSGRVDNMDGCTDNDDTDSSLYEDNDIRLEGDFQSNPHFQSFLQSISHAIETTSLGLTFDFENLCVSTHTGQKILQQITGSIPRGSCWGIMGPSGAGKSTLVNVLMGKTKTRSGTIKINGHAKATTREYRKVIGYVPQDDILVPELTIRENILHSARCRLPARWKDKAIQAHVDALIACLQLSHVQDSRVGDVNRPGVSGGQRKRTSIGIELAAAPMAIFLDEPTSGLDASSAASLMRLLKGISRLGVTIIAIVHQPREQIFYGFDQVLLLAQGRMVYSGPTAGMEEYFERMGFQFPLRANPADTLMDILTGDGAQYAVGGGAAKTRGSQVDRLIDEWKTKSPDPNHQEPHPHLLLKVDNPITPTKPLPHRPITTPSYPNLHNRSATLPAQILHNLSRTLLIQTHTPRTQISELLCSTLAGTLIGLTAYPSHGNLFQGIPHPPFSALSSAVDYISTPQLGLLAGMSIGLCASAPGYWVLGAGREVAMRERRAGGSVVADFVGKQVGVLPRLVGSSFHFTVVLDLLASPSRMGWARMWGVNVGYFWCIYGLAGLVSVGVRRKEDGPLVAVLGSLVIGVLGGVAPPLSRVKEWGVEWFWRLSPGVWFAEAYFTENLEPLGGLYRVDLASRTVGYTLGRFGVDVG